MGRFGRPLGRGGMGRFAVQNAAWAGRGGAYESLAQKLAAPYTNVIAISTRDMTMVVRDSTTPANNYSGPVSGKATINGTLTAHASGALFSDANNLTFASNIVSWTWAEVGAYVEIVATSVDNATGDRILSINDGTFAESMELNINITPSPDQISFGCRDGNVEQASLSPSDPLSLSGNMIRAGWKANDFAVKVDGGTAATDPSGTMPTITRVDVGYSSHTASRGFKGRIPTVILTPVRNTFLA